MKLISLINVIFNVATISGLSEALAKMRFSTIVSRADVKEAVRLMRVATQAAATDPRTGRIDMVSKYFAHAFF